MERLLSIYKNGVLHAILKESFGANRDKTVISLNENLEPLLYMYISSEIDFSVNKRYWTGFYCESTGEIQKNSDLPPFEFLFESLCKGKLKDNTSFYEFSGKDVVFSIPLINSDPTKKMRLIALDSEGRDNVGIFDFGCIEGCQHPGSKLNFTGKIESAKIKMNLEVSDGKITGLYRYDRYNKNIGLEGKIDGQNIEIYANDKHGRAVEKFEGKINDGLFSGKWIELSNGKTLPFNLYLSII